MHHVGHFRLGPGSKTSADNKILVNGENFPRKNAQKRRILTKQEIFPTRDLRVNRSRPLFSKTLPKTDAATSVKESAFPPPTPLPPSFSAQEKNEE